MYCYFLTLERKYRKIKGYEVLQKSQNTVLAFGEYFVLSL